MLDGFWYIAAESRLVRPGRLTATVLANQAIVLVRTRSGTVQALEDRCAHRGVPLSSGRLDGESIQCPYHGWRFSTSGACLEAPVLGAGAAPKSACVRSYPVQEQDGWVWIYIGNERCPIPVVPPPAFPVPADGSAVSLLRMSMPVKSRMEFAVDNFIDPAHVPFVHAGIFRQRKARRLKEKEFIRLPQGFRTVSTNVLLPNTIVFRAVTPTLAPAKTTVDFLMPGIHLETFEVGTRWGAIMVVVTPLTEHSTRLDFTMGWNFLRGVFPLVWLARLIGGIVLRQDRRIIELQEQGHRRKNTMNLSLDSDRLAVWYRQLQKYHLDQLAGVSNLQHPVPEKVTLRWVT